MAAKMAPTDKSSSEQWSSGRLFVWAASGAAIGLNNIWQFPYFLGQHGSGAFLFVYILCLLVIALPLLMAHLMLGRAGRKSPIDSINLLIDKCHSDPIWTVLGWMLTLSGFFVLSYLSVIAGWTISYAVRALVGSFGGLTADGINSVFNGLVSDPEKQIFWHSLFMMMTMIVAGRGIKSGFEPVIKAAVPTLFVLLALLLAYASATNEIERTLTYLFYFDLSNINSQGILVAMGHAFFSLGLGFGVMMAYSAYLPSQVSIIKVSTWVIFLDLLVGILAGIIVYAILFSADIAVDSGPMLVFQSIPLALDSMPLGALVGTLFFVLLTLTAWLTAIALIEPIMQWCCCHYQCSRFSASIVCGLVIWCLGVVIILSFNYWSFSFDYFGYEKNLGFFDTLQIITSNFLLPLAGILLALFAGWAIDKNISREQLNLKYKFIFDIWLWLMRIIIPLILFTVMFSIPKLFL